MVLPKENNPVGASTRRALGVINQNYQPYPFATNKKPLSGSGNHTLCEKKKQPHPLHRRPITRKYGAQTGRTKAACPQETNGFGECIFIDEEYNSPIAAMALELPEATRPSEEDQMEVEDIFIDEEYNSPIAAMALELPEATRPSEEDQMEVEDEDPILDIDGSDAKNPLAVVDYVADMYVYYRKVECCSCVSPEYMAQQPDITEKMRAILIDWLIEVHDKFELLNETLFLTVNLIDRFLSKQPVARKKLQLVGLVALLLACKYEEVSVPVVGDMILISDNAYTKSQLLEMERLMLNTLQFNMSYPTPYVFLQRFLKAAQSDSNKLELLSHFLIELSLVEYEMVKYTPSLLAAGAIYTAQCTLYGLKQWNKSCEWHSSYSEDELLECSRLMVGFHQRAGTGRLTGVHRKYCTSKFGYTAKLQPATFLLDLP